MIKIRIGYSYKEGRVGKKLSACTKTPTHIGLLMLKTVYRHSICDCWIVSVLYTENIPSVVVSGKKRTPHGPADPNGSKKMSHTFNYNIKMYHF